MIAIEIIVGIYILIHIIFIVFHEPIIDALNKLQEYKERKAMKKKIKEKCYGKTQVDKL